jgi:putative transposase
MLIDDWQKEPSTSYRLAYLLSRFFDTPIMALGIFLVFVFRVQVELEWLLILVIGNLVLPVGHLAYRYYLNRISDLDITHRHERISWYTGMALFWVGTLITIVLFFPSIPRLIMIYQFWLAVFGVLNAFVTYYWKISAHAMLSTGLTLWLFLLWNFWFLLLLFTFVPLICWARFRTKKHTVMQLVAGVFSMLILIPLIWLLKDVMILAN